MIGCIQIGESFLQGEVTGIERRPVRKPPAYELEIVDFATINGRTAPLVRPFRRACDECRQIHGTHLDWCPQRD
jgi:hypothetical protein